jgi:ribosomal protein S18 acetylase RimI-like enzyme
MRATAEKQKAGTSGPFGSRARLVSIHRAAGRLPAARLMNAIVELLPVDEGDREFLYRVYASTRAEELAVAPWDDAQKDVFLRAQFDAQDRWYHEHNTRGSYEVIVVDGEPAGRLCLHRGEAEIRIVDMALLPEHRGNGVGTSLLLDLLAEAPPT